MRQLAVLSDNLYNKTLKANPNCTAQIWIGNHKIPLGMISVNADFSSKIRSNSVLVKKLGFSLNYRDQGVILSAKEIIDNNLFKVNYVPIGSDFVGRVVKTSNNNKIENGSLVIPNCTYDKSSKGLPTNCSSKEFQVFNKSDLMVLKKDISFEKACVMGIGLHTSYSMIRKSEIKETDKILITSITSNTSLFILNLLKSLYKNEIYGISHSGKTTQLDGVKYIYSKAEIEANLQDTFDVVFDPFADSYLKLLIEKLNLNGRYVSCGFHAQIHKSENAINSQRFLMNLISKNIKLIGNCLGVKKDMEKAIKLVYDDKVKIPLDSTFKYGDSLQDFIDKSFSNKPRLGKVAFIY